jgi:D-alanine-D-alanine ligase-like ATP-grasp enzyme
MQWPTQARAFNDPVCPLAALFHAIRAGVDKLMREFDLRFAALDFLVGVTGQWCFLEVNPNGQWVWIEDATRLPITTAVADALLRHAEP